MIESPRIESSNKNRLLQIKFRGILQLQSTNQILLRLRNFSEFTFSILFRNSRPFVPKLVLTIKGIRHIGRIVKKIRKYLQLDAGGHNDWSEGQRVRADRSDHNRRY